MADIHGVPSPSMVAPDLPEGRDPVEGPNNPGGYIQAAPPGTDHDAGSSDTISDSIPGAVAAALASLAEHEAYTRVAGSSGGDLMPLPPSPLKDETILGYVEAPNLGGLGKGLAS